MPSLIVASNSPRRQQLIRDIGFAFQVKTLAVDETCPPDLPALEAAEYLAKKKNAVYQPYFKDHVILTADTLVICHGEALGKPASAQSAFRMMTALRQHTHRVVTGVCISSQAKTRSLSDITHVQFGDITDQEIRDYIHHHRPFDKAGAYGIQEWIGMIGIHAIHGSYYNVMGLPTHRVYQILKNEFGIPPTHAIKT